MKGDIRRCEEIKDVGGILDKLRGSVWKGVCGCESSSGKGNDPVSNTCDGSFGDSCTVLDLDFPEYFSPSVAIRGSETSSKDDIEVDDST